VYGGASAGDLLGRSVTRPRSYMLPNPMAPVRTLIMDDHADVRFLIRAIIADAGEGVEVVGEADGLEAALAQLDATDPDVVVVDARMPRIDGFEAAPLLLARRPSVVLVLCTGWVDDEVRRRAADAGFAEVVSKDRFDDLPATVLRVAGRAG
jgi:DNA-binding NarL/FixJ family response regulator